MDTRSCERFFFSHEYAVLRRELHFTAAEFDYCNDLAAAHSFLPDAVKRQVWPRPIPAVM